MDLVIGIWMLLSGVFITLIGFKIIDLFKPDPEKGIIWYRKWGGFFKYGGIVITLLGCIYTMSYIIT